MAWTFCGLPTKTSPLRHRSLRAVFDQSWNLLSDTEQRVFRRLSFFRGGFRQSGAEQVAGASFLTLVALTEKSLLHLTPAGRYHIHESLWQFAQEKLQAVQADQEEMQDRHSDYYLAFLHRQEKKLQGKERQATLQEIGEEIDNIQLAWHRAVASGNLDTMDQALESLYDFYYTRSWFQIGHDVCSQAADRMQALMGQQPAGQQPKSERLLGRIWARQGQFCDRLGLFEPAHELAQIGLAIARLLDNQAEIAFTLNVLGRITHELKGPSKEISLYQESLAISRTLRDQAAIAYTLLRLGTAVLELGERPQARKYFQESLAISRAIGHQDWVAWSLDKLAVCALSKARTLKPNTITGKVWPSSPTWRTAGVWPLP